MSEDKELDQNPETEKKVNSRKFAVWLTWVIIASFTFIVFFLSIFITKNIPDSLVEIVKIVLKYLFVISCEYLGVNLVQKGIFAAKDIFGREND